MTLQGRTGSLGARFAAAVAFVLLAAGAAGAEAPVRRDVFIGTAGPGYARLAVAADIPRLLANPRIGLYQHAVGTSQVDPARLQALWATWRLSRCGTGDTVGEVGGGPSDAYLAPACGRSPGAVNANAAAGGSGSYVAGPDEARPGKRYGGLMTAEELATMRRDIDFYRSRGAPDVAPVLTPNDASQDLDDRFATSRYWANTRAAALHGGALALDPPPSYAFERGPAYLGMVAQMIAWANAQGLRTSVIVSPWAIRPDSHGHTGGCGFDPTFLASTRRWVSFLQERNALPVQWVVESYCPTAEDGTPGTANDVAADGTPGSLNEVALFLADSVPQRPYKRR